MAGWISQKFSGQNLKSINYTSRCDSIHLLGRCLVQIYGGNSTTLIYSDSTFITSDIFEEKTINIDPAWTQNNDSLTIRFIADGYNFPLQPKMEGYAIFSIDEVDINYITSTENNILDKNALDISPNPSAGIFNLKLDESFQPTSIQVYNIIGQEILDRKYTSQINLSDLDSGTYIISVQTKLGVLSNKITLW